jgi:hypothetical protein
MKTNPILMKGTKGAPIQKNMHSSALKFGPGKKKEEIVYGGMLPEVNVSANPTYQGGTLPEVTVTAQKPKKRLGRKQTITKK